MKKYIISFFIVLLTTFTTLAFADNAIGRWQNINISLSGLAKMQTPFTGAFMSFVGVVDSKNSSGTKVVIINLDNNYNATRVDSVWPGSNKPSDLESIATIPNGLTGTSQQFVTVNSSGEFWRFTINSSGNVDNLIKGNQTLTREGDDDSADEIESVAFFINQNSNTIKWVWAGRGSRDHSAYMFSADLSNSTSSISYSDVHSFQIQETNFNWPRPIWSRDSSSRLISDVKVADNGSIYISSAFDAGDEGPFGGVLYNLGTFIKSSQINFSPSPLTPITPLFIKGAGKKVEALELLDNSNSSAGFILGSDDEDLKGYVLVLAPQTH